MRQRFRHCVAVNDGRISRVLQQTVPLQVRQLAGFIAFLIPIEFLRTLGSTYTSFLNEGVGFPRVHVECDYLSSLRFDDLISTAVTVERVGATSFTLAFAVSLAGRAAARGKITVVCTDPATGRPRPVPERLAAALGAGQAG